MKKVLGRQHYRVYYASHTIKLYPYVETLIIRDFCGR